MDLGDMVRTDSLPDGSRCCSMHDTQGRRGIWFTPVTNEITIIAGREGDDAIVTLKRGDIITMEMLRALEDCLGYGAWMQEEEGPGVQSRHNGSTMHPRP